MRKPENVKEKGKCLKFVFEDDENEKNPMKGKGTGGGLSALDEINMIE